jgi:peptide deformylase
MILQILREDDKLLYRKAKRISKIDDEVRKLSLDMLETMISSQGVGLSGNQVGVLKQIIVFFDGNTPVVMINPTIISSSEDKVKTTEGCLSFPGEYLEIERPDEITVKYRDISGIPIVKTYIGLSSRIIQHEIDHLSGIVFRERL